MALVSIIIACREIDNDVKRCLYHLEQLPEEKEIIVVPDSIVPGFPSGKRNWGMKQAKGDIYAFIDSDAYPSRGWLRHALFWLRFYNAVCGPGPLPPDAPFKERIADQVHKWMFAAYRVTPQEHRIVKWFPTFNLIVKKEYATEFEEFLTGEDDKFGEKIPGGIFYHPSILVYHNRRGAFRPLWKQFGTWGRHKGHFQRLALIAWITTLFVYIKNYIKGFLSESLNNR